jgi:Family of unknown function (DUF5686)/CarboxypepD_reg-like domain
MDSKTFSGCYTINYNKRVQTFLLHNRIMRQTFFTFIFSLLISFSFAGNVTGVITDNDGKILPYSSIFVKGTSKGINANNEGKYSLYLEPGQYTLICQHVGYKREEKVITVTTENMQADFSLKLQEVTMSEVILTTGNNPANEIIRNTIKKRKYYQDQLNKFQCEVYTKGQLRVRSYPNKIFGQKVNFEDGDTSKQKMLYLSETISTYSVDKPHKEKIEVLSSKVSGQSDGYGLSAPQFFSLYDNNVFIGNNLNPRGFISPISDNAMNYYRYKYQGTFYEDGKQISKIRVIPKRKYEPLFSGYINIVEDEWRIHSVQLLLTKESQMQLVDSLRLEQMYRPVNKNVWVISSQVIYPSIKIFGFDAYGSFINIYSNFNIEPKFDKKTFNNTILKYTDSSTKKPAEYWERSRPVPLLADEVSDYKRKDSLELARKDPRYIDSLDRIRNKVNIFGAMFFGQTFFAETKRSTFHIRPLTEQVSFNIAEGLVINTGATWTKRLDSSLISHHSITLEPNLRYGFLNHHFNAHLKVIYTFGTKYASAISLSGGKRVFQFNNSSPIGPRGNTISSLLGKNNRLKIYEAWYLRGSFTKGIGHGFTWTAAFQYQDRMPLDNRTDYSWSKKANRMYTPNYPNEIMNQNIERQQVLTTLFGVTWQPGARYIELPGQKINIGSRYPVFSVQYIKGINNFLGSDADFSKWNFTMKDNINFKLLGRFRYKIGLGGFFNHNKVEVPDYQHFNGNQSTLATEYLNSFQLLPIYQYSNVSDFYSLAHIEHNFNGFLTNKIPGIQKLNLYLVVGANGFYINSNTNYYELFAGFDNIFKRLRIDFVQSFLDGKSYKNGIRIGLSVSPEPRGDDWP